MASGASRLHHHGHSNPNEGHVDPFGPLANVISAVPGLDAFAGLSAAAPAAGSAAAAIPPLQLSALGEFAFNASAAAGSSGGGHVVVAGPSVAGGNVAFVTTTTARNGSLIVSSGSEPGVPPGGNGGATLVSYNFISDQANFQLNFFQDAKNPANDKFVVGQLSSGNTVERGLATFFQDVKVLGWNSDSILLSFTGTGSFTPGDIVISTEDMSKLPGSIPANTTFTTTGAAPVLFGVTVPEVPCFAAGTRLATPAGQVPVESLRAGDAVMTAAGLPAIVVWAGARTVACHAHPAPEKVWPVRVRRGAFGPGLPARDLLLSPDHSVLTGGVLIPVRALLNGTTVAQERVHTIRYHHVELALHDILLAEGLPTESFLDLGNHRQFEGGEAAAAHPDFTALCWEAACVPIKLHGPEVAAARALLARHAPAALPALAA